MVGQVKIVGILMLAHGILVILVGGALAALGSWFMFGMPAAPAPAGGPPPALFMSVVYGVLGGVVVLCGLLQAVAGYRVMTFRNRVLGIVAAFSNLVVFLFCNCELAAVGVLVYGLIVLFNSEVARAFELVGRGATPEEAIGRFTRAYGDARDDYDEMSSPRREWEERRRRRRMEDDLPEGEDDGG